MDLSGFRCRGALFSKGIITWGLRPKFAHKECAPDLGYPTIA